MHVFSVPDVTRKVRHLRIYYGQLLRSSSKKKLNCAKRWKFFDKMEFLREHIILKMSRPICNVRIHFNIFLLALGMLNSNFLNILLSKRKNRLSNFKCNGLQRASLPLHASTGKQ